MNRTLLLGGPEHGKVYWLGFGILGDLIQYDNKAQYKITYIATKAEHWHGIFLIAGDCIAEFVHELDPS